MADKSQQITEDDVHEVAALARIDVSEEEAEAFTEQLSDVLEYYEQLSDVPSVDEDTELHNVMRPDEAGECLSHAEATRNGTTDEDGFFEAPSVSGDDE